jgi:hypothetical protein
MALGIAFEKLKENDMNYFTVLDNHELSIQPSHQDDKRHICSRFHLLPIFTFTMRIRYGRGVHF